MSLTQRLPLHFSLALGVALLAWACGGTGAQPGESATSTGSGAGTSTCAAKCADSGCCIQTHGYAYESAVGAWGPAVALDPASGDIIMAAGYTGAADAGFGPLPAPPPGHVGSFVARYEEAGNPRWHRGLGTISSPGGTSYPIWAGISGGNVFVVASFSGDVDFGCGLVHGNTASTSGALIKLAAEDGACIFSRALGEYGGGAVFLPGGDIVVTGSMGSAATDLGCGLLAAGQANIFVSRRKSSDGSCIWSRVVSSTQSFFSPIVAVDAASDIYVATALVGSTTFGGEMLSSKGLGGQPLLLKYGPEGSEVWPRLWGTTQDPASPKAIAVTPDQNVWLAGVYAGPFTFGSYTLPSSLAVGQAAFVAGVTPSGEILRVAALYPDEGGVGYPALAADSGGRLFVAAAYPNGTLHVGGTPFAGPGTLLAKLDPSAGLAPVWTKVLPHSASPFDLVVDGCGDLLMTGSYAGVADLGCGSMQVKGTQNPFWARFHP